MQRKDFVGQLRSGLGIKTRIKEDWKILKISLCLGLFPPVFSGQIKIPIQFVSPSSGDGPAGDLPWLHRTFDVLD